MSSDYLYIPHSFPRAPKETPLRRALLSLQPTTSRMRPSSPWGRSSGCISPNIAIENGH